VVKLRAGVISDTHDRAPYLEKAVVKAAREAEKSLG
jgi:hypothetical protein